MRAWGIWGFEGGLSYFRWIFAVFLSVNFLKPGSVVHFLKC
jgi:hypothetical protein